MNKGKISIDYYSILKDLLKNFPLKKDCRINTNSTIWLHVWLQRLSNPNARCTRVSASMLTSIPVSYTRCLDFRWNSTLLSLPLQELQAGVHTVLKNFPITVRLYVLRIRRYVRIRNILKWKTDNILLQKERSKCFALNYLLICISKNYISKNCLMISFIPSFSQILS